MEIAEDVLDVAKWWFIVAYACLAGFCFGMGLYRSYLAGTLTRPLWILFGWFVPVFLALDFLTNTFCGTILLWELPQWTFHPLTDSEVLLTARLSRWEKVQPNGGWLIDWRIGCAKWICHNLLDPLSPNGPHCH